MRAYRIEIDGITYQATKDNPYALQVSFDFVQHATFSALLHEVTIRNVVSRYMSQEVNLVGKSIKFYAGMQSGLPLAKKDRFGLIFSGKIQRAIKIVEGVETKLTLLCIPSDMNSAGPVFTVKKGADVVTALKNAMSQVSVSYEVDASLTSVIAKEDNKAATFNLSDLASIAERYGILMYPYAGGVRFALKTAGDTVAPIKTIASEDLIGQPVATDTSQIVLQTTMRGDLVPYQRVRIPNVRINPNTGFAEMTALSQTGIYTITELRHVGDYRNMSADAWVTQLTVLRES